ncbi:MAG: hypothetical protein L6Q95_19180 [Planctomycetes bacterium]|nr:hypothetical protein [Planctomycetota bacterium]
MMRSSMAAVVTRWKRRDPRDARGGPVRVLRAYRALARFDRLLVAIANRADWHHVRFHDGTFSGLPPPDDLIDAID